MIPKIDILTQEITEIVYPTRTYKIEFAENIGKNRGVLYIDTKVDEEQLDRINGYTDGLDALAQAIYLILGTERYEHLIYSWDYGVELIDLYGKPMPYVMSELPRRVKDALTQDDRIDDVVDFEFNPKKSKLHATFKVVSNIGNVSVEMEVAI
jgi:hypothetical protein